MATEQDVQREALRAERARQQLTALQRNADSLALVTQERERALATLRGLAAGGADVLVPVGAGTFLRGSVRDTETLLRGVGAGVVLETSVPEAVAALEREIEELQAQTQRLVKTAEQVAAEADEAEARAEQLMGELGPAPGAKSRRDPAVG